MDTLKATCILKAPVVACLLVFAAFMAGCTTSKYTAEYCAVVDLEQLAREHAGRGMAPAASDVVTQCGARGVNLEIQTYQSVYQEARESFCENTESFYYGYEGQNYEQICTAAESFGQNYDLGKSIYDLKHAIWQVENRLDRSEREIETYRTSASFTGSKVDELRKDVRDYKAEIGRLRIQLYEQLDRAEELGYTLE